MRAKEHSTIKSRILKYAMDLWGVKDAKDMDPVVDLLLDVFANESYLLQQEICRSDAMLLRRLSSILVDSKWSLPFPAHALMSVSPNKGESVCLDAEDHFYAEKYIFGKDEVQVFFTPLYSHELIDAKVAATLTADSLFLYTNELKDNSPYSIAASTLIPFNVVWIALDIDAEQLEKLSKISLCVLPQKWDILPFLKAGTFYDAEGNVLRSTNGISEKDVYGNAHYYDGIKDYYNDLFFDIDIDSHSLIPESARSLFNISDITSLSEFDFDRPHVWLKMKLPEIIDLPVIDGLRFYINTFPIVNRKLVSQQHNFKSNGNIIPLYGEKECDFLNIRCIQDDNGNVYVDKMNSLNEDSYGVFSLYFGDLERFDSSNAKSLIRKLLQSIREEGNAFAAMKPDTLTSQLKRLFEKINIIETEMASHKDERNSVKAFALTIPEPNATYGEIKYWGTSGEIANGFSENCMMHQFNMDKFDGSSIYLRTETIGGKLLINDQELIRSMRYGLLTKNRIVSKEDIRSYILHKIGNMIRDIDIHEGVGLSSNPNKGLVRVTEIHIKLNESAHKNEYDYSPLSNVFEKELSRHSVIGSNYKVCFI